MAQQLTYTRRSCSHCATRVVIEWNRELTGRPGVTMLAVACPVCSHDISESVAGSAVHGSIRVVEAHRTVCPDCSSPVRVVGVIGRQEDPRLVHIECTACAWTGRHDFGA